MSILITAQAHVQMVRLLLSSGQVLLRLAKGWREGVPIEATFTGYASISMQAAKWQESAEGILTYPEQLFTASQDHAEPQVIEGYYVTQGSLVIGADPSPLGTLRWAGDQLGLQIEIDPRLRDAGGVTT